MFRAGRDDGAMTRDAYRVRGRGTAGTAVFVLAAMLCRSVSARTVGASTGWHTTTTAPYHEISHAANLVGILILTAVHVPFASAQVQGVTRIGETCSSDGDCYDGGQCLGVCCSSSSIPNCETCGATEFDPHDGNPSKYGCAQCEDGYETYNKMSTGYQCRKSCEEGDFHPDPYTDWCTSFFADGASCSGTDAWCASGTCGGNYCCGAAEMVSVFDQSGECCTLCSNTGACLATAACQQSSSIPPPSLQPTPPPQANFSDSSEKNTTTPSPAQTNSSDSSANNMTCTTEKLTAGQNCYAPANGNDHLCASGKCGGDYCCDEAEMRSVFEQTGECCVACSLTGACCSTSPAMCASNTCDASAQPTDGDVGNCTAALSPGSTCAPTCDDGFTRIGQRTCNAHTGAYVNTASCLATCGDGFALLEARTCDSRTGEYNATATCVLVSEVPPPPPPPPSTPYPPPMSNETIAIVADAAEKKAQAEETRDTLLASVGDTKTRAVVKLLADAAIAGVQVKKVEMALAAENENDACAQAFVKMQLDAGLGACDVTTASSTSASTRRLHATATFSVTVFVNPKTVDAATLATALANLAGAGVAATTTDTNPMDEMRAIPGLDVSIVATFETEATLAAVASVAADAAMNAPLSPPPSPPPAPPPKKLVLSDYESSARATASTSHVYATALALVGLTFARRYK